MSIKQKLYRFDVAREDIFRKSEDLSLPECQLFLTYTHFALTYDTGVQNSIFIE